MIMLLIRNLMLDPMKHLHLLALFSEYLLSYTNKVRCSGKGIFIIAQCSGRGVLITITDRKVLLNYFYSFETIIINLGDFS